MGELITALTIIARYMDEDNYNWNYPTTCNDYCLYVTGVNVTNISFNDINLLIKLGFIPGQESDKITINNTDFPMVCANYNFKELSECDWNILKHELSNCFRSYKYGGN